MEKPEWFEKVGAFEGKPSVGDAPKAASGIPQAAKRLFVIGAAAVFAAGGIAFAASTITGAANAVNATPAPTASPTATTDPVASPVATATTSPVVGGNGARPSIAGGGSGDDEEQGDDNQGDDQQAGDDGGSVNVNAQVGINQDDSNDD